MVVLTQLPLQSLLRRSDYTGRIAKWGTILGAFDIKYMSRTAIKGLVLADLVPEFTEHPGAGVIGEGESTGVQVAKVAIQECSTWKLYVDRAANQKGPGVGIVIVSPN